MKTVKEIKKEFTPILDKLSSDTGVPIAIYSKPPSGKEIMMMAINRQNIPPILRIWPGTAAKYNIIDVNEEFKQAVVRVKEDKRTVTIPNTIRVHNGFGVDLSFDSSWAEAEKEVSRQGTWTHIQLPTGTRRTSHLLGIRTFNHRKLNGTFFTKENVPSSWDSEAANYNLYAKYEIRCAVPASDTSFLIGSDENDIFVSQLPSHPKSVTGAHKALRPKGLSKKTLRQGEFFFDPVFDINESRIQESYSKAGTYRSKNQMILNKDHIAEYYVRGSKLNPEGPYVKGNITNSRHETLELGDTWHRVIKNLEIEAPAPSAANNWRAARWD